MDLEKLKEKSRQLRTETYALYLAGRHPLVPWYAKLIIGFTVAYALSPIDLIPDFIPVIGYLDDLVIVPLGLALALKMVPPQVLHECRQKAELQFVRQKPVSVGAALFVIGVWMAAAWWLGSVLWKLLR